MTQKALIMEIKTEIAEAKNLIAGNGIDFPCTDDFRDIELKFKYS